MDKIRKKKEKKEEEGGENDSPQNLLIQLKQGGKTRLFVAFGCSWRNYHLAVTFFYLLTGLLLWELLSCYRRCYLNQN